MDIRKVKKLIELIEASDIAEIEVKEGDDGVRISRFGAGAAAVVASSPATTQAAPAAAASHAEAGEEANSSPAVDNKLHVVKSPMVGTFYKTPSPDAQPFVEVGDRVSEGDTVCLIEAMKMFNQIECEVSGTVKRFLVESGQPVEYGHPLVEITLD